MKLLQAALKIPATVGRNNWGSQRIIFHFLPLTEELEVLQSPLLLPVSRSNAVHFSTVNEANLSMLARANKGHKQTN